MLHGLDCNSEGEGIGAGAAMAFQHLGHFAHGLRDTRKDVAHNADADESGDGQADLGGIDSGVKAGNNSGVLHFADAFGNRGKRQADAASEFGKREPSIVLQFLQNMPASLVKH